MSNRDDCSYTHWTTSSNEKVAITEMDEFHIRNILRLFYRRGYVSESTVRSFWSGPYPHGEIAGDIHDAMGHEIDFYNTTPWIGILNKELVRRNLSEERPSI